jgi:AcrR family transcriptional regulator
MDKNTPMTTAVPVTPVSETPVPATPGPATRWGKGTRADSLSGREQILDAALRCYASEGVIKTTVEHVAREAKVSRTTVYRYFKNRDEVLSAVVLRESMQILQAMQEKLAHIEDLVEFLVEGMVFCLVESPKMPLYPYGFGEEGAVLTSRLSISSEEVAALGVALIQPFYDRAVARGTLRPGVEPLSLVEWVVRILLSYMVASGPSVKSADDYRRLFYVYLAPALRVET